jgi:hypothetical protein
LHFLHFTVFDSKSAFNNSSLHSKQFRQQIGKTPTVGGDFRLCREESGGGERKDDFEAIVTLLQLLGLSKFLGGTPMMKK